MEYQDAMPSFQNNLQLDVTAGKPITFHVPARCNSNATYRCLFC
jgi:hypothetical protein